MLKIVLLMLLLVMAGCTTTGGDKEMEGAQVEDRNSDGNTNQDGQATGYKDGEGMDGSSMSEAQKYSMQALNDPNSPLSIRTIYFAFDSSEISAESQELLIEHARFLSYNPEVQVVLEGHADERGTRDYNLALGERRGKSVHEFLTSQGVNPSQLDVISYGEERPVALEHDDSAWQLNRRVELIYP